MYLDQTLPTPQDSGKMIYMEPRQPHVSSCKTITIPYYATLGLEKNPPYFGLMLQIINVAMLHWFILNLPG